jgi:hypothetical protein
MTTTFEILAPGIFICLAAICKAVSDTLADHYGQSIFAGPGNWWNKETSWKNKWKDGHPGKGERFPGSSTVFVFLTDAWHLFNAIQYTAWPLAVVWYWPVYGLMSGYGWLIDAIILKVIFTGTFEVFYRWVFIKRK